MHARMWLAAAALLAGATGLTARQPADPPPGRVDPVTAAAFLQGTGALGRFDPYTGEGTHVLSDVRLATSYPDWVIRRHGLPALYVHELPAGDDPPPRVAVPFALLVRHGPPTAAQLARLADQDQLRALSLPGRLAPRAVKQVGTLKQLRLLSLNAPDGDGLAPLAGLTNLRQLEANLQPDGETDLRPLAALADLRRLDLGGINHPEAGLAHLAGLPHLEELRLSWFHLTGDGLRHLAGAKRLTRLHLTVTATDAGIAQLGTLTNLDSLALGVRDMRESTLAAVGRLRTLRRLSMPETSPSTGLGVNTSPAWVRHLAGLESLEYLDMSSSQILTDDSVKHLAALRNLKELRLHNTYFGDAGLAHLGGLADLEVLDLSENWSVTGAGLKALAGLKKLRVVNLRWCAGLTPDGLKELAAFPAVEHLDLGRRFSVRRPLTDEHLGAIAGLKTLKSLRLDLSRGITDGGLHHLAGMHRLEELDLSENSQLRGPGLGYLAGLPRLHTLRLARCEDPRRPLDLSELPRLAALRTLDLSDSPVGDAGLKAAAALPRLESLRLSEHRPLLTADGVKHVAAMKGLAALDATILGERADELAAAVSGLAGLRSLSLKAYGVPDGRPQPDRCLRHLRGLKGLRTLVLGVGPVRDEHLEHLLGLKQLETLIIGPVSPAGLAKLRDALPETHIHVERW
jgi:hypothetical protein